MGRKGVELMCDSPDLSLSLVYITTILTPHILLRVLRYQIRSYIFCWQTTNTEL